MRNLLSRITDPEKREQGFTLIELLVVIIIIGILAAIAIPIFLNQKKKAADATAKSDVRNAVSVIESTLTDNSSATVATVKTTGAGKVNVGATAVANSGDANSQIVISSGNSLEVVGTASAYCVDAKNSNGTATYYYASDTGTLGTTKSGACASGTTQ